MKLLCHKINPTAIKKSINSRIQEYEADKLGSLKTNQELLVKYKAAVAKGQAENWRKPPTAKEIIAIYDESIETEKSHYALVRVIEANNQFYLNYGKGKDTADGTGPFDSLEKAIAWFTGQGR